MSRQPMIFLFLLIWCLIPSGCEDLDLTGTWDCTLLTMLGISHAKMQLTENNGQLTGRFEWIDLNLPIKGTVNFNRQVNIETQDTSHRCIFTLRSLKEETFLDGSFSYYQDNVFSDAGSFESNKR